MTHTTLSSTDRLAPIGIGAATLAALALVHGAGLLRVAGFVAGAALVLASVRHGAIGLLAAPPLLYAIRPTPPHPGPAEILLVTVLGVAGIRALIENRAAAASALRGGPGLVLAATVLLVAMNFAVAVGEGTPLADWLRGLTPFVFLATTVPYWLAIRRQPALAPWMLTAIGVTAFLFAAHVLGVYIAEQAWRPNWYVLDGGSWIRIAEADVERHAGMTVEQFAMRVTLLLQQSTDALVPLGVVLGVAGFALAPPVARVPALALAAVGTSAVVVTFTRSMILAALVAVAAVVGIALRRSRGAAYRALSGTALCLALATALVSALQLEAVYRNRLTQLYDAAAGGLLADENVTGRLDEYRIAWGKFRSAPMLGHGLGTKHRIRYGIGFGESIEAHVGYVHNWPLYMLMVGGVTAFAAYTLALLGPLVASWRRLRHNDHCAAFVVPAVALLAVYGLFFAVFRLVSFNLLLAILWALALAPSAACGEARR